MSQTKELFRNKIESAGIVMISLFSIFGIYFIHSLFQSMLLTLLITLVLVILVYSIIDKFVFYEFEVRYKKAFSLKKSTLNYSQIRKVELLKRGNIRFETNPSLVISFSKGIKGEKKLRCTVQDGPELINFLRLLKRSKKIPIVINSKSKSHQNLTI